MRSKSELQTRSCYTLLCRTCKDEQAVIPEVFVVGDGTGFRPVAVPLQVEPALEPGRDVQLPSLTARHGLESVAGFWQPIKNCGIANLVEIRVLLYSEVKRSRIYNVNF